MNQTQDQFNSEEDGVHVITFTHMEKYNGLPERQTTIKTDAITLSDVLNTCQIFLYASGFRWPKNYVLQFAPTDNFPREILDDADTEVSVK
jgi:hypothetical protein